MRFLLIVTALSVMAVGFVFGALNPAPVDIDLFGLTASLRLGSALLVSAFVGAVAAGIVLSLLVILPLRRQCLRAASTASTGALARDASE